MNLNSPELMHFCSAVGGYGAGAGGLGAGGLGAGGLGAGGLGAGGLGAGECPSDTLLATYKIQIK